MNQLISWVEKRDFQTGEKYLLQELQKNPYDIELLFRLAMVRLQMPFADDDGAVGYLNKIIELEPYNFEAIIIKMYLQNFYCAMDEDFQKLVQHQWEKASARAIVYYIVSWKYDYDKVDAGKEEAWLVKSIEEYPCFVYPFIKLAYIKEQKGMYKEAKRYYLNAINNIEKTEFLPEDSVSKEAFINEYITGTWNVNPQFIERDLKLCEEKIKEIKL